jgi:hypothetical protein
VGSAAGVAPVVTVRAAWLALLALSCAAFAPARDVSADGTLPPIPYRYLHPPAALASQNSPPLSANVSLSTHGGVTGVVNVFTKDGQVGLTARPGAFQVPSGDRLQIAIAPVDMAVRFPGLVALDGNVYSVQLSTRPAGGTVHVLHAFNLTFRWPHLPTGIYVGSGSTLKQLCYTDQGTLTGFTLTCRARTGGIYAAGTSPTNVSVTTPNTPIAHSRLAWLDPYIPILAAILVLIATSMVLYAVAWPRGGKDGHEE